MSFSEEPCEVIGKDRCSVTLVYIYDSGSIVLKIFAETLAIFLKRQSNARNRMPTLTFSYSGNLTSLREKLCAL